MIQHLLAEPEQLGQLRWVTAARLLRHISVNAVPFTTGIARTASKVGAAGILSPPLLPQVSAALHQAMGFFFSPTAQMLLRNVEHKLVCALGRSRTL